MISAGILIGSLAAVKLATGPLATPMIVLGACFGVVGLLPFAGSAAVLLVGGVAIAVANTILITTFQNTVPEETQGRVFGALGAVGEGLRPLGLVLAAPLLALAGVAGAFVVVGLGVITRDPGLDVDESTASAPPISPSTGWSALSMTPGRRDPVARSRSPAEQSALLHHGR